MPARGRVLCSDCNDFDDILRQMHKTAVYYTCVNGDMHKVTRLIQHKIMNGDIILEVTHAYR